MIQLSQRDDLPKQQPPIEKLQKAFSIISEDMVDGLIKQVIMTPFGKQTRFIDPLTNKLVRMSPQSFQLGHKSSEDVEIKTAGIVLSSRDEINHVTSGHS